MPERDPRVDPRPGDVLKAPADLREFTIDEVTPDGSIIGRFKHGQRGSLCSLWFWRKHWAKDALVIRRSASDSESRIAPYDVDSTGTADDRISVETVSAIKKELA